MGKSTFIVAIIGVIGILVVMFTMMYFLDAMSGSKSSVIRLGLEVADRFEVDGVRIVRIQRGRGEDVLSIEYNRRRPLETRDELDDEMDRLARYTYGKYPTNERYGIGQVKIKCNQYMGSGCTESVMTYTLDHTPEPSVIPLPGRRKAGDEEED